MKLNKYIAYTTHTIVCKFHVSIYKREKAINIEVQPKIQPILFRTLAIRFRYVESFARNYDLKKRLKIF